jgi:hypothetical protein
MSKSLHALAVVSQVAVLIAGGAPAHAQSSALLFQRLTHSPIGTASLRVDSRTNALDVSILGPAGDDGVAVKTPGATSWTARLRTPVVAGLPLRMSWNALSDGRRIGSGLLRQTGDRFEISAVFTGQTTRPTFSAQVYRDGRLISAIGGLPSTARIFTPIDICEIVPQFCEFTGEFHTLADGACMIRIISPTTAPITLPNGTIVLGNELRLVEEVRPAGHYPYLDFDTMTVQSDASSFEILSETVR